MAADSRDLKVTIETNGIIDLELSSPYAADLRAIVGRHGNGVTVAIPAIAASERKQGGGYERDFGEFRKRLQRIGLDHLDLLMPLAILDMTFFDWCLLADAEMVGLDREIQNALHPAIEDDYAAFCQKRGIVQTNDLDRRWRNARCDVLGLWCHIYHRREIFVTRDRAFHQATKRPRLAALGAGRILTPRETPFTLVAGQRVAIKSSQNAQSKPR